jgi:polyisoprenoid-binding protein YceI
MSRKLSLVLRVSLVVLMAFIPGKVRAQSATFASFAGKTGLPVQRLDIDWAHSAVEFSVRFMGLSNVRGAFSEFGGTIMVDTADARRSTVSVVIRTKSINTNVESRDKDLRSENFFDAEKYPVILFRSERVDRTKTGFVARGPLTMHGVTKPVAIAFKQTHALMSDAWGNRRVGFAGKLSLNRKDYGILGTKFWNSEFDPGRMSISDNVDIDLNIEAEASQVEKWTTPRGDSLLKVAGTQGITKTLDELRVAAADTASPIRKLSGAMLNAAATKLMHRGDFSGAAEVYRTIADLNPSADWAYAGLGEAYLMSGKRAEAADNFRKALAIEPLNTVASEYLRHIERSTASR